MARVVMSAVPIVADRVLFRKGPFVFQVLTADEQDVAAAVLAEAFLLEPFSAAAGESCPEWATSVEVWEEFINFFVDDCSTNGLSVLAIDTNGGRVAGVFHVRDVTKTPKSFFDFYESAERPLTHLVDLLVQVDNEACKKFPLLANPTPGEILDLWFLGVHPDFRGRGLANLLVRAAVERAKAAGFKYAVVEASSAFTSKACALLGFQPLVNFEARNAIYKGQALYRNCTPPHGTWTYWLKPLTEETIHTEH